MADPYSNGLEFHNIQEAAQSKAREDCYTIDLKGIAPKLTEIGNCYCVFFIAIYCIALL